MEEDNILSTKEIILQLINDIFPKNKIPLFISNISPFSSDYISWLNYEPDSQFKSGNNNYCQPDELNNYYAPLSNGKLKSCEDIFNPEIISLIDLNTYINTKINKLETQNQDINNQLIKYETKLNEAYEEYMKSKTKLENQDNIIKNLDSILSVIRNLNNDMINKELELKNQLNIINDINETIDKPNYNYLYIYIIITLFIITLIIQIIIHFV